MKYERNVHLNKLKILHQLTEDDPDRRMEFYDPMITRIMQEPSYLQQLVRFTDEYTFFNGTVNRLNI